MTFLSLSTQGANILLTDDGDVKLGEATPARSGMICIALSQCVCVGTHIPVCVCCCVTGVAGLAVCS